MEKITDLMKERYGIKQTGKSLNVTPSDTLYTIFRKTADYIYRNGEWTEEDEKAAIKGMIEQEDYFGGDISNVNIEKTTLSDENIGKITDKHNIFKSYPKTSSLFKTNGWKDHVYKVSYTDSSSRNPALWEKSKTIILDPDNKVGTLHKHNYDIYDSNNDLSSELKIGNLNRAIGYDKLCTDILRELKDTDNREQVSALLARITNPENSGKKRAYLFTHDAYYDNEITPKMRKEAAANPDYMIQVNDWQRINFKYYEQRQLRNQAVDSISDYLEDTYNLTLQMQYEVDIEAQTHAKSWQTKKNINKATLDAMEKSSLKQDFKDLELDNDVDIDKFKKLEPEIRETVKFLPQSTNDEKPILRFRKLGNHHATGLFVPFNNTLAVDFRSYESKSEYRPSGVGIESFIHEYGHFLDYNANNSELSKNGQTRQYANRFRHILSMQDDFKEILHQTQHEIQNRVANGLKMSSHFVNYYTTPTEVYARAFEVYSSEIGLQNSLLKDRSEYKNSLIYSFFTDDTRKKIVNYFDNKFPNYRQRVQEYNQTLEERTQYKQKIKVNSKSVENAEQQDLNLDLNESDNDKKLETEKQELDNSAKKLVDELKKDTNKNQDRKEEKSKTKDNSEKEVITKKGKKYLKLVLNSISRENLELLSQKIKDYTKSTGLRPTGYFSSEALAEFATKVDLQNKLENSDIGDKLNILGTEFTVEKQEMQSIMSSLGRAVGVELSYIDAKGNKQNVILPSDDGNLAAQYLVSAVSINIIEPKVNKEILEDNKSIQNKKDNNSKNNEKQESSSKEDAPEKKYESYKTKRAKQKLARLEKEFSEATKNIYNHYKQANGQPMNDKRGGNAFFNKANKLDEKATQLSTEIEKQKELIEKLEWQDENKALGLNKQGGLIMSVDNIPRIKAEIEKAKQGESHYNQATIRKYKKELAKLEEIAKLAETPLSPGAKKLVDDNIIKQWKKKPSIYFVNNLRGVALELTEKGNFQVSQKYTPKDDESKATVEEILEKQNKIDKASNVQNSKVEKEHKNQKETLKQGKQLQVINKLKTFIEEKINNTLSTSQETLQLFSDMQKFNNYSARNQLLILAQKPNATGVRTFDQFKKDGYHVKKGEKGIKILKPVEHEVFQRADKSVVDVFKATASEKEAIKNGNIKTQKKLYYKLQTVFDVSQTNVPKEEYGRYTNQKDNVLENTDLKTINQGLREVATDLGIKIYTHGKDDAATIRREPDRVGYYIEDESIIIQPQSMTDKEENETLLRGITSKLETKISDDFSKELWGKVVLKDYDQVQDNYLNNLKQLGTKEQVSIFEKVAKLNTRFSTMLADKVREVSTGTIPFNQGRGFIAPSVAKER